MRPRVYLLLSLAIHLSYAHLTALKKDDFDKGDDVDAESDSSLDKNDNFSQIDSNDGAKTTNSTDKEESSDNLGKIRVSIGDEIAIDTGGTSYTGTKTPLIIISPISIIDYARLYKKMESSKNESNVVMQEKLAMSDANSRLASLYKQLKDAESRLAFYKADKGQLELLNQSQS